MIKSIQIKAIGHGFLSFENPETFIIAQESDEVLVALSEIERYQSLGKYIAGYIAYEAGWPIQATDHFDYDCTYPLICLGVFSKPTKITSIPPKLIPSIDLGACENSISFDEYHKNIEFIIKEIRHGNTYQVNYTFPLYFDFSRSVKQKAESVDLNAWPYAAYIEMDNMEFFSASPELFFRKTGKKILCKPMKGTMPRGKSFFFDRWNAYKLQKSKKNHSENIMIADMVRNDLGKIASPGSVLLDMPYKLEAFPGVWQMTSGVSAEADVSMKHIFQALFPSASITGAPKLSTMRIINQIERSSRGIYTGSIGYISPENDAQFNVAIRTLVIDKVKEKFQMNIGSGITADSNAKTEYQECLTKASFLKSILVS